MDKINIKYFTYIILSIDFHFLGEYDSIVNMLSFSAPYKSSKWKYLTVTSILQ